jgi:hypothetical protein
MPLEGIQSALENGFSESIRAYEELATKKTFGQASDFVHEDICMLEGILSHIWQGWCHFCRDLIIESCTGTTDISGNHFAQVTGALSEQDVSSAAIRIKQRKTPIWGQQNSVLRYEPTWGDVDVLTDIISGTGVANGTTLRGMCTMASPGAKILQRVRNAAAHHNPQTVAELLRISGTYSTFPISHPCQALFWVESTTGKYLLPEALDVLIMASMHAVI